ncbi:hypothetical protein [Pontibacter vulgaris]|uniref:hypothetical protein n=1 Tax=Pontibacter vulgaris TaxID=2905679 RepID=UPI001FA72480|nr:hypothetical protein [Pontibacter vulgaris]
MKQILLKPLQLQQVSEEIISTKAQVPDTGITRKPVLTSALQSISILLLVVVILASCSPLKRSSKAIVIDEYGHSMRYENGRRESKPSKKWDKKSGGKKKNYKKRNRY